MKKRPTQFTMLPAGILQDLSLNSTSKLLYSLILSLASRDDADFSEIGICYANNNYLASNLGVSVKTIQKSIKELENNDYVSREEEPYRPNQQRRLLVPHTKGWDLKFKSTIEVWKEKKGVLENDKKDEINDDINENLPF